MKTAKADNIMVQPYMRIYVKNYHSMIQKQYGISHFYEFSMKDMKHQIQAVPDGSVDVFFQIGQKNIQTYIGGTVLKAKKWVFGDGEKCFGVRFLPGQCILPKEIEIEQIIDCDLEVDGNCFGNHLLDSLSEKHTLREYADIFLKAYCETNREVLAKDHSRMLEQYMQRRIVETSGLVSIRKLSEETGYTECYIRRAFKKIHGISPKIFARFVRFQQVLRQMEYVTKKDSMEEIALNCGYYDQSHMIKDFKCFAGTTPESYRNLIKKEG